MQQSAFQSWIKSKCIGLTGGIATGKSTVAGILKEFGFVIIDADKLARDIMVPGRPAFKDAVKAFGDSILNPSGAIDRKKLAAVVFGDPVARAKLEAITHNRIKEEFFTQATLEKETLGASYFFYEAALIFEVGRAKEFYKTMCTWCSEDEQIKRLCARNNITAEEAKKIITSQMPAIQKRDLADIVIDTSCSLSELKDRVSKAIAF